MNNLPPPARYKRPPSREEENAQILLAQRGNEDLYVLIHSRYRLFLLKTARRYCGKFLHSPLGEDLMAVANLAFHEAIKSYDPSRGTRFVTLLWIKARRHLLDEVRKHMQGRSLDTSVVTTDILDSPGCSAGIYDGRFGATPATPGGLPTGGIHPDAKFTAPEIPGDNLEASDLTERLEVLLAKMSPHEREVIKSRFWKRLTMQQMGFLTGKSRTGARAVVLSILNDLEELLHE